LLLRTHTCIIPLLSEPLVQSVLLMLYIAMARQHVRLCTELMWRLPLPQSAGAKHLRQLGDW
jgi:hypothetical protein